MREIDTVARFGGDEFVVLLAELELDRDRATQQARSIANKISVSLAAPYHVAVAGQAASDKTIEHCSSASIGVVIFLADEATHADVLDRADTAMYKAKQSGKNAVCFFTQPNLAE